MSDDLELDRWKAMEMTSGHWYVRCDGEEVCAINSCASRDSEALAIRIAWLHNEQLDREKHAKFSSRFKKFSKTKLRKALRGTGNAMPYLGESSRPEILRWMDRYLEEDSLMRVLSYLHDRS